MYLINIKTYFKDVLYAKGLLERGLYEVNGMRYISLKELRSKKEIGVTLVDGEEVSKVNIQDLNESDKKRLLLSSKTILSYYKKHLEEKESKIEFYKRNGYKNLDGLRAKELDLKERAKKIDYSLPYIR